METSYYTPPGALQEPTLVRTGKASELVAGLLAHRLPFVGFNEFRQTNELDIVVLTIQPEVPQHPFHDIRSAEKIAVCFPLNRDGELPFTIALRQDFPHVPHLSVSRDNEPVSLCLTEESPEEQLRTWTAARYGQLLHRWLRLTARGELHPIDQPLEPVFLGSANRIILPARFYEDTFDTTTESLRIYLGGQTSKQLTYVAVLSQQQSAWMEGVQLAPFINFLYTAQPRLPGSSQRRPTTLAELHEMLEGDDFLGALRQYLLDLQAKQPQLLLHHCLFFIRLPKQRTADGAIETIENWVFATAETGQQLGDRIGLWWIHEGKLGALVPVDQTRTGNTVNIDPLIPTPSLTPQLAAILNNVEDWSGKHFFGIGAGALGSQVINNLFRAGASQWTILDDDTLLGHNLARHYLPGFYVGMPKAEALATLLNATYGTEDTVAIVGDVLTQPLVKWIAKPIDAVIDLSASIAVGRYLAFDDTIPARRLSAFLNPAGSDLVLLAEDSDRTFRMDWLEMEYYRAIVHQTDLTQHLLYNGEPIRYSYACRDVSSQLPQDQVSLLAAVTSRGVRTALETNQPTITIWQSTSDLTITRLPIEPVVYQTVQQQGWTLLISARVTAQLSAQRLSRLPNETGGVLIGTFDMQRKLIYVVDQIPSPPDSQEWPMAYIRGVEGLPERLTHISQTTAGQLGYLGEWHSHPIGCSTQPSGDDRILFEWLREHRQYGGFPPFIAIVGDENSISWYIEQLPQPQAAKLHLNHEYETD
jgi:hypothetical protein